MQDTANRLGITFPTVVYWMEKYSFSRRSNSDSAYYKANPKGDPFDIKRKLNKREKELMLSGLMLYWAEGNKSVRGSMQLANLDHRMLKVFLKFLRKICRVNEGKLRLYVRVYKKFSKEKAKKYWIKELKMSPEKIHIYRHTNQRSKTDKQWSQYGIATLQCHNLKLSDWIDSAIEDHLKNALLN